MAKPTTTGKDYGHKLYMNTTAYPEAIGRPTDKQYDNRVKRPHSDDKKPYREEEYPEMEHYWTPYDPPNLVPPGMPDDPRIPPNRPDNPSTGRDPDDEDGAEFTGCLFSWNAGPSQLKVGETSWHSIDVGNDDPLVGLYVNFGPVKLLRTSAKGVMGCINGTYPTCFVRVIAIDFDPEQETEHGSMDDSYLAQVVGVTAKGFTCTWDLTVTYCPPTVELEYDYENSAETIAREASVAVIITGGAPPFIWTVAEEGYTLRYSKTNGRSNVLTASADSCGTATIEVIDECDEETTGGVRNTTGYWDQKSNDCELRGTPNWNYNCIGGVLDYIYVGWGTFVAGGKKLVSHQDLVINGGTGYHNEQSGCEAAKATECGGDYDPPCLGYNSSVDLTGQGCRYDSLYTFCFGTRAYFGICKETAQHQFIASRALLRTSAFQPTITYYEWECA